ncbi:MAG TPA: hypothetical protein VES62_08800 [Thermoleophilaceae bacterium]|nr:hypothetical protein [Thermoleophilaceae bacterium]
MLLAVAVATRLTGALSYREFRGDDLGDTLKVQDGDLLTAAVLADMSQMRYGGFQTFVNP